MTNQAIRKKAWAILRGNKRLFVLFGMVYIVCIWLMYFVESLYLPGEALYRSMLSAACGVLLYPITGVGFSFVCLQAWKGEKPKASHVFRYVTPLKRLLEAWGLGLICVMINSVFSWIEMAARLIWESRLPEGLALVIRVVLLTVSLMASFLVVLAPYLYALSEDGGISEAVRRGMKGVNRSLIGLILRTYGMMALLILVAALMVVLFGLTLDMLAVFLLLLVFMPVVFHLDIAVAGYTIEKIPPDA